MSKERCLFNQWLECPNPNGGCSGCENEKERDKFFEEMEKNESTSDV